MPYPINLKTLTLVLSTMALLLFGHYSMAQTPEGSQDLEDRPVQIVKRVPPQYPTLALAKKTEGWVKVAFTITTEGDVDDISVLESEPAQVFDRAAVEAVNQFKFLAPVKNGELMSQRASQLIEFELPDQDFSSLAVFGGFLQNLNKAQGIARQAVHDQFDVMLLTREIRIKSNIKTHKPTLNQLVLKVIPDANGYPESINVVRNDFDDKGIELNVAKRKAYILEGAKIAAKGPSGYYNPNFIYTAAKNHSPSVYGMMEAKSMPIPDYSFEMVLTAKITIDKEGHITEIKEADIDGEPVTTEFMDIILGTLIFEPAYQDFKPVKDTVEFTMVTSLVQKSDVEAIKRAWMMEIKTQINGQKKQLDKD